MSVSHDLAPPRLIVASTIVALVLACMAVAAWGWWTSAGNPPARVGYCGYLCALKDPDLAVPAYYTPRFDPPARFKHPYKGTLYVVPVPKSDLKEVCTGHGRSPSPWPGGGVGACTFLLDQKCYVVWPKGVARSGSMWVHEMAHCNGWSANHED